MKRGEHPNSRANLRPRKPGDPALNPGGRPKTKPFSDAARLVADLDVKDLRVKSSDNAAVAAAKVQMREALKGKTQAFNAISDRAEGRPPQQISGPDGGAVMVNLEGIGEALSNLVDELDTRKNKP